MIRQIDLTKSVYELCNENPELPLLLKEIGFHDITKPGMLATAGRFMTIPKGAALKNLDMSSIQRILYEHGYEVLS